MLNYNTTEKLGSITLNCNHFKQKSFTMSRLPGKRLSRRQRDDEGNKDAEQGIRRWECQQVSKSCMKLGKLKSQRTGQGPGDRSTEDQGMIKGPSESVQYTPKAFMKLPLVKRRNPDLPIRNSIGTKLTVCTSHFKIA